jgi:DNA-binding transcriptional LysR family regulator
MVTQRIFDRHGLKPWIRMELSTSEAIKQAILAGLGVSIMSRYTRGLDVERSQLVTLNVEGFPLEHHWYFVYPAGKQLSLVARTFMDFMRVEAKRLVYDHLAKNGG